MVNAIHIPVEVKEPKYSNVDTAMNWTKDKTKDFFKLIRDTFRWIGHYSLYAGHNASAAFGVGDRFSSAVALFGIKSLGEDIVKMTRAKNRMDFTEQTANAAIHGSGTLKVVNDLAGTKTPHLGTIGSAGTIVSSSISTYKANAEIERAQNDSAKSTNAQEKTFLAAYQNERRLTIVQNISFIAMSIFSLGAAAAIFEVGAVSMLALSSFAIITGMFKYSCEKTGEFSWKQLRYDEPNSTIIADAKYHPSAWKKAIA